MSIAISPVSKARPIFVRRLSKQYLKAEAAKYFNSNPPDAAFDTDYEIYRCAETSLEFAWPMYSGSPAYYDWLANVSTYYPEHRWEFERVLTLVREKHVKGERRISIIDVGGGSGYFASKAMAIGVDVTVTDFSRDAVNVCIQRGCHAHLGEVGALVKAKAISEAAFDLVTSFHCLEHVSDPVSFVNDLVSLIKPEGSVFVSTPCSPMHFEAYWFDPQNHPPHHMTRWTPPAYEKLANRLNLDCKIYMPKAKNALSRAVSSYTIAQNGPHEIIPKIRRVFGITKAPVRFLKHYTRQLKRPKHHGQTYADIILVEFRKRNAR